MTAAERLYAAVSGGTPDRVPSVPKIWVDLGARLTGTPLTEVIADPFTALRVIARAGKECGADAVRQFHFPPRRVLERDGKVYEVDPAGDPIGEVDMAGGLSTHLYDPSAFDLTDPRFTAYHHYWSAAEPFVRDIDDARRIAVPGKGFYVDEG